MGLIYYYYLILFIIKWKNNTNIWTVYGAVVMAKSLSESSLCSLHCVSKKFPPLYSL